MEVEKKEKEEKVKEGCGRPKGQKENAGLTAPISTSLHLPLPTSHIKEKEELGGRREGGGGGEGGEGEEEGRRRATTEK